LGPPDWISLSLDIHSTVAEFFRYASYACFYVLAVQLLADNNRLRFTVKIVVACGFFIALIAFLQEYMGNGKIFWLRQPPAGIRMVGPYVYRNHFAGYMGMVTPLAISLFFYYRPRLGYARSVKEKFIALFSSSHNLSHVYWGSMAIVMAASISMSLSRGGILSFSAACLVLLVIVVAKQRKAAPLLFAVGFLALVVLAADWFTSENVVERFSSAYDQQGNFRDSRLNYWQDSVNVIKDFLLTGTGMGTFGNIFPTYQTRQIPGYFIYHAHNDYLELLTDGGLIAFGCAAVFFCPLVVRTFQQLKQRQGRYAGYLYWGALAGLLAILLHSMTDFNFQSGANGLYFYFLASLLVAGAYTGVRGSRLLKVEAGRFARLAMIMVIFAVFTASLLFNGGMLLGRYYARDIGPISWTAETPKPELIAVRDDALQALRYDPLNSYYHYVYGYSAGLLGLQKEARKGYIRAIFLNPAQSTYNQDFGFFLAASGDVATGEKFLEAGIRHDRANEERCRDVAAWYANRGEKHKALVLSQSAMQVYPEGAGEDIAFLYNSGFTNKEIRAILPERAPAHLAFARHLQKLGEDDAAASAYREALKYVQVEESPQAVIFSEAGGYFLKTGQPGEAALILQEGVRLLPSHAGLRQQLAAAYTQLGLPDKAAAEYRMALTLEPGNEKIRLLLKKIEAQ
jgi:O-antigen ligase/Tfp pilus assembly protein PilF